MSKLWIAALALVLAIGIPALAKGKGENKGNAHADKHAAKQHHGGNDKDKGWEKHDGYELRVFARNQGHPPGWSKGKKTGWRDCGLPPGQAKKYGCYTYVYGGRRYYYYHDDGGRLIIRRPTIHISAGVDIVR
ncbi:MAG: hypothetical protein L0Z53_15590 [Acidobacteriales bacterium]|nr:hypothetical protein [Terriglobales bacterium]